MKHVKPSATKKCEKDRDINFSCSRSIRKIKNKVTEERRGKAQNEDKTKIVGLERSTKVLEKKDRRSRRQ